MYAETTRRDLNNGIFAVFVKVLVQAALTGVIASTEHGRRPGKAFVCVIAYRAVGHGRKHYGKLKL